MQPKQCIAIIDSIKAYAKQNPTEAQVYEDWFQAVVNLRDALPQDKRFDAYKYSGELRSVCASMMAKMKTGEDVAKLVTPLCIRLTLRRFSLHVQHRWEILTAAR